MALTVIQMCGAKHPTYKNLFCSFGPEHECPHGARIRRGCWVTWIGTGAAPCREIVIDDSLDSPGKSPKPPMVVIETAQFGTIGSKSKGKCWYCGDGFSHVKRTLDHVVPRSKGGSNDLSNLVFACQRCNSDKGSMSLEIYRYHSQVKRGMKQIVFYGETC